MEFEGDFKKELRDRVERIADFTLCGNVKLGEELVLETVTRNERHTIVMTAIKVPGGCNLKTLINGHRQIDRDNRINAGEYEYNGPGRALRLYDRDIVIDSIYYHVRRQIGAMIHAYTAMLEEVGR